MKDKQDLAEAFDVAQRREPRFDDPYLWIGAELLDKAGDSADFAVTIREWRGELEIVIASDSMLHAVSARATA